MGEIIRNLPEWNSQDAENTRRLALQQASHIQEIADSGFFKKSGITVDIEQESLLVDHNGDLYPDESIFDIIDLVRPDVSAATLEYDASNGSGPAPLTSNGIEKLLQNYYSGIDTILRGLRSINPNTFLANIGTHPFLTQNNIEEVLVKSPHRLNRYKRFQERSIVENQTPTITITNNLSGDTYSAQAACWTIMTRCVATQIHISSETVEDALRSHNTAIALAAPLSALFANSPYISGFDAGIASTRLPLTLQSEQMRSGLPRPAFSLEEYYLNQLNMSLPLFISDDPESALRLNHGTIHTTSRVITNIQQRTIRNEYRFFDSQTPETSIQALLLTYGATQAFNDKSLPSHEESKSNYLQAQFGLQGKMIWKGVKFSTSALCLHIIDHAQNYLDQTELRNISREFLLPLQNQVSRGLTPADILRSKVLNMQADGLSFRQAVTQSMLEI